MICKSVGALAWMVFAGAQAVEEEPVAAVQALLRQERLYVGPVNGVLDPSTAAGVRRYQIVHGLRATGRLDDGTLRLMLAPPAPSPELSESDQRVLRELAQAPIPDPVAEHRRPLPPFDPPSAAPVKPQVTPQEPKRKRVKAVRHRQASGWSSSD
jgi:peptidoglycan hydrolase-like protein with peptidoglycan-binding domain